MRDHLERAVRLATEQGRPAARCEALAALALEAARLGFERSDEDLLSLAERSANEVTTLMRVLPGHPPWGAAAHAALAQVALARGEGAAAVDAARSALRALEAGHIEDLRLRIVLPAVRAIVEAGAEDEREAVRRELQLTAALIAQRITDEELRVTWFRGPLGRELSDLAGARSEGRAREPVDGDGGPPELGADDTGLLWLLIEGRTNREIARELGLTEDDIARRLAEMYAKIGVSSRGEAAVFAFREGVV
jgi:ATP/maltotriose-dependent transcriptional regulator MalT